MDGMGKFGDMFADVNRRTIDADSEEWGEGIMRVLKHTTCVVFLVIGGIVGVATHLKSGPLDYSGESCDPYKASEFTGNILTGLPPKISREGCH